MPKRPADRCTGSIVLLDISTQCGDVTLWIHTLISFEPIAVRGCRSDRTTVARGDRSFEPITVRGCRSDRPTAARGAYVLHDIYIYLQPDKHPTNHYMFLPPDQPSNKPPKPRTTTRPTIQQTTQTPNNQNHTRDKSLSPPNVVWCRVVTHVRTTEPKGKN